MDPTDQVTRVLTCVVRLLNVVDIAVYPDQTSRDRLTEVETNQSQFVYGIDDEPP